MSHSKRRILGIDPGLAHTGFGVVDSYNGRLVMIAYGTIDTATSSPHPERLLALYNRLIAVIDEFGPNEAAMERLYFARNATSCIPVAEAKGVASLCLAQHCLPLAEYTPNQIKQSVTGSATADKELVEQYVRILLKLESNPRPDHAADALSCAITHIHCSGIAHI